jgi:hypothetical protein
MEDKIERELLIKDLYCAFQKNPREEWIAAVLKQTNGFPMVEFIDACKQIERLEMMPQNLGSAIWKIIGNQRKASRDQYHATIKSEEPFETNGYGDFKAPGRFLRLISKTLRMKLDGPLYRSFWQAVDEKWKSCQTQAEYERCMELAEEWSKDLKLEVA